MKKAGIWAAVLFVVMLMTAGCGAKNQKEETAHLNRVMENIFKSTDEKSISSLKKVRKFLPG